MGIWVFLGLIVLGWLWWQIYQPLDPDSDFFPPRAIPPATNVPPAQPSAQPRAAAPRSAVPPTVPRPPSPAVTNLTRPAASKPATNTVPGPALPAPTFRQVQNVFEAQLALNRLGISSGSLDGAMGSQTRAALSAFQRKEYLPVTGELDAGTKARLWLRAPPFTTYRVTFSDLGRLRPLSVTWLGKSQQDRLDYETVLELVAEMGHAYPNFIRRLNPSIDWANVPAGTAITLPNTAMPPVRSKAARVRIHLAAKSLEAFDQEDKLLAHFPCSIARRVEKRPAGVLRVAVVAANPNYRFDPKIFPESEEGRRLGRTLMLPPGPNNPVGVAWIGLDKPGYGIHGTPSPEAVGRTESHGCFRLANWNAEYLLKLAWVGMPVDVEP
ncbi:MAG: murein L,D-transpeptidase [Pedosphaera parvula]|nr:murein L,D-transpeptidase [Pedosphaera parvula]